MAESRPLVGTSVPRSDGVPKVTGEARYVDDLPPMPGELFGATVRSQLPRGRLRDVRFDPAFDWSTVTRVVAADIEGLGDGDARGVNTVALIVDDQPVLASTAIQHAYEPVVLLAAADRGTLARAAAAVTLDIEPLPAALDAERALAGDPVVWGQDNVQKRYLIRKGCADVEDPAEGERAIDAALAACAMVVRGRYTTQHQEQLYIEPQGVVAWWDDDGVHVTGSIQCPFYVHKAMVKAFAIEGRRVHVSQAVTGGGFGGKEEYPSVIALHAALLSRKSARPVRMVYDRREDIEATTKRHPSICDIESGCDADGTLRVLKMRVLMDGGAYVTLTPVVLSRGVLHAAGAYRWRDARIEGIAVATSTPPNGAFRGFGAPQTIWAMERHMDKIAAALGRDPLDLKRQNVLVEGDSTATGQVLRSSVAGMACVEAAVRASDYHHKRQALGAAYASATGDGSGRRVARGIGAAVFMHGAGFTGSGERYLKGKVAVDLIAGGRLRIRTASTDIGQGTETVFRQIAADAARLGVEDIDFAVPCTTTVPDSGPTVASRTVMVVGSIVERAARDLAQRVAEERAAGGGSFAEAGDRLLGRYGEVTSLLQYEPPEWVKWDDVAYKGDAYPCFGWACDVAEVEVDLDTYEVAVTAFWSATDVGKAIHPLMCKGQIEGGSLQAVGWAIYEDVVWKDGRILNPRMTNYIIPTALDAPRFETLLVEAPFALGPGGGAKGIGELPMDGGAPAVAAAVEHALGVVIDSLPLSPERLLAEVQARAATIARGGAGA
jgi:CO/xanthine dehydrogenase Mo-binding subunit